MTSDFEIQGCPAENKKRKHLHGSGETAKEKQDRWQTDRSQPNEVTGSSLPELKTGRLVLSDKF